MKKMTRNLVILLASISFLTIASTTAVAQGGEYSVQFVEDDKGNIVETRLLFLFPAGNFMEGSDRLIVNATEQTGRVQAEIGDIVTQIFSDINFGFLYSIPANLSVYNSICMGGTNTDGEVSAACPWPPADKIGNGEATTCTRKEARQLGRQARKAGLAKRRRLVKNQCRTIVRK